MPLFGSYLAVFCLYPTVSSVVTFHNIFFNFVTFHYMRNSRAKGLWVDCYSWHEFKWCVAMELFAPAILIQFIPNHDFKFFNFYKCLLIKCSVKTTYPFKLVSVINEILVFI